MDYQFDAIEPKWQDHWKREKAYEVPNVSDRPKYYVLDMFPYPSGAGLHVGHPLGYIASDIFSRYKRLKGFNVLHPMGYDSFGLPAEQYALETGQHPAVTTEQNINTFRSQLDKIGFCFDWSREIRTSDPAYYKWTQWIFLQLFNSFYNRNTAKATPIAELIEAFAAEGNIHHTMPNAQHEHAHFDAAAWQAFDEATQQDILMQYRLAFCGYGEVNWCEALGTVLANDEVVNGVSERGGFPVEKKKLRQWYLRITEYADRLLEGLTTVDFSDAMKEMQTNWIGKSTGAEIAFNISNSSEKVKVYTTRPDTIFGVDFIVIAPEHELVDLIKTEEQSVAVDEYVAYVKSRSERERIAEKKLSGCFTGAYAENPFNGKQIPIWISEYVLAGYGTGAIMAVPCGDDRDFRFATQFQIPITNIIGDHFNGTEANATKDAILQNSGFLDGVPMKVAMDKVIEELEARKIGERKTNFRMRDAAFSRQRYWGEPFPITWKEGIARQWTGDLPLELPQVDRYSPGPDGQGPLANIPEWVAEVLETNTMPGYAGSSWYFLRYMDPHNNETFCDRTASDYWNQVDLYIGGTEHAVGHLLYSRLWTKVLFDLGFIGFEEPFKKLLNQGMITSKAYKIYRIKSESGRNSYSKSVANLNVDHAKKGDQKPHYNFDTFHETFVSADIIEERKFDESTISTIYVPLNLVDDNHNLNVELFAKYYLNRDIGDINLAFINKQGVFSTEVKIWQSWAQNEEGNIEYDFKLLFIPNEKMSKTKLNVENPNDIVSKYGADTFRMYEMFLGPVEMSKPWDTKGIEGVHRFLRKCWRLFYDEQKGRQWNEDKPTDAEYKILHRTIKKIEEDTERFSFNTAVSTFMICVNELADLKCHKRAILEPLLILLTPYAPHLAEELWHQLGNESLILDAAFPQFDASYLVETTKEYPVSVNGKVRTNLALAVDLDQAAVEEAVLQNEIVQKWLEGNPPKKIIYVKNKMINVVI